MLDLNKEREAFEAWIDSEFSEDDWYCEAASLKRIHNFQEETQSYYCGTENDMWMAWFEAKAQAVLDTQQKLTDTYFWEGSDYVVDCPFEYDIELDKGEVLELQKWQRTESTRVYFANIYKDEDNFEILQFASKAEAENAVAENLKFLEASESGAEG
ncbi:hypothetical protein ABTC25_12405 [Acinetobacter baumannii]|nr:hypothetical protein [Acinetobacter baumannii]